MVPSSPGRRRCASAATCPAYRSASSVPRRDAPGKNWPERGRPPIYLAFGEPMRADDGETAALLLRPHRQGGQRTDRLRDGPPRAAPERTIMTTDHRRPPRGAATENVVKHMKWWGWGVEGVGFHHEDKPGFAPFVQGRRPRHHRRAGGAAGPRRAADPRAQARRRTARAVDAVVGGRTSTPTPTPDRAHVRQEPARPGAAAHRRHPADSRRRRLPRRRGGGAADHGPGRGRGRRAHPVRRRQQHLRQPGGAARESRARCSRWTWAG